MINYFTYDTKFGKITLVESFGFITNVIFDSKVLKGKLEATPCIKDAYNQLVEYFDGRRTFFSVPINPKGTSFQQKVWSKLYSIPYGETRTYKDIAKSIGDENASRAVGNANNKNPIPIFIPCHRVIGSDGKLVGYALGLDIKEKLLELEQKNKLF